MASLVPMNVSTLYLKAEYGTWSKRCLHVLLPVLHCHLTMPMVKGRGAHEPIPEIPKICVFKCGRRSSSRIKHGYNEFVKLVERYFAYFDNVLSNLSEMVTLAGMCFKVSHICLHYMQDYGTSVTCILIKSTAMRKLMAVISCQNPHSHLKRVLKHIHIIHFTENYTKHVHMIHVTAYNLIDIESTSISHGHFTGHFIYQEMMVIYYSTAG